MYAGLFHFNTSDVACGPTALVKLEKALIVSHFLIYPVKIFQVFPFSMAELSDLPLTADSFLMCAQLKLRYITT